MGSAEKRQEKEPQEYLLPIDQSFWLLDRGFVRWQLLRRNERYKTWVENRLSGSQRLKAQLPRYFRDYRPEKSETFNSWEDRVWRETAVKKNHLEMQREIKAASGAWRDLPSPLPDRWLPVPTDINFPHPKILNLLTATTVGFGATTVPFSGMKSVQIEGRSFWVDLSHSFRKIDKEIRDYLGVESSRQITDKLKTGLAKELLHRQRNTVAIRKRNHRKRGEETPPRMARILCAWDLKQSGRTYREIVQILWPEEFSGQALRRFGSRQALLQRAKEHVKNASKLIAAAF